MGKNNRVLPMDVYGGASLMTSVPLSTEDVNKTIVRKPKSDKKSKDKGKKPFISGRGTMTNASTRDQLNQAMDCLTHGKYNKALEILQTAHINEIVEKFLKVGPTDKDLKNEVNDLIRICKSFYEYDEKNRTPLPDKEYNRLLVVWGIHGLIEPTGIVPDTGNKVAIVYENLHNNMDKCYVIYEDDPVPEGVKETDSLEAFFTRAYALLGIEHDDRIRVAVSPKIDGVSVNGTIKGNLLAAPQTRGDESGSVPVIGLDGIQMSDMDKKDQVKADYGIQFEVFLTDSDMQAAGEYLGKDYANNRNAVSGLIKRLCTNPDPEILPYLSFYPIEASGLDMRYEDRLEYIENFRVVPDDMLGIEFFTGDITELCKAIKKLFGKYADIRGNLSYTIDGLVITISDDENQQILGRKGRTNKYQIALKFDPENAIGVVSRLDFDCGRKGYRTPQVYLETPVILGGAKYDHIPVLSTSQFESLGIRVGSVVNVHRVGDVIPSITMVSPGKGALLQLAKECPICGTEMILKNKRLYCANPGCKNNQAGRILSLFAGIKLDRYSDVFVESLITLSEGAIHSPGDLLRVTVPYLKKLGMTDLTSMKFPERFMNAMEETPDYVILGSFGIPDLGRARARQLLAHHNGIYNLLERFDKDGVPGLELRKALGKIGRNLEEYFMEYPEATDHIFKELQDLLDTGYISRITVNFDQMTRVGHTGGDLSEDIEDLCESIGFEIVDGQGFDILITADKNSNSSKMIRARRKELPIFTQEEFLEEYGS